MSSFKAPNLGQFQQLFRVFTRTLEKYLHSAPSLGGLPGPSGGVGPLVGTFPLSTTENQLLLQAGYANSITTDANGRANVIYPTPFPNGVLTVVCQRAGTGATREIGLETVAGAFDTAKATFLFGTSAGAPQAGVAVSYSWIAIGW